jgi:hypothetical protein
MFVAIRRTSPTPISAADDVADSATALAVKSKEKGTAPTFPRALLMTQFAKETLPISLEEEMRRSYLDYAMSVIVGRALPDARDGLKPVHRRVLFAMHELNNDWNRPTRSRPVSWAT